MAKATKSTTNSATKKATSTKTTSRKTSSKKGASTKKSATSETSVTTRSNGRPAVTYVEEYIATTPMPVFEYDEWGGDEGDRAQYATALAEHVRQVEVSRHAQTVRDDNPMPFVELMYPKDDDDDKPEIVKCFVSEKKSFMHLEDGAMQLSILSPVGKWIWENRQVKPGDIIPFNGATVLAVGFRCLKNAQATAGANI